MEYAQDIAYGLGQCLPLVPLEILRSIVRECPERVISITDSAFRALSLPMFTIRKIDKKSSTGRGFRELVSMLSSFTKKAFGDTDRDLGSHQMLQRLRVLEIDKLGMEVLVRIILRFRGIREIQLPSVHPSLGTETVLVEALSAFDPVVMIQDQGISISLTPPEEKGADVIFGTLLPALNHIISPSFGLNVRRRRSDNVLVLSIWRVARNTCSLTRIANFFQKVCFSFWVFVFSSFFLKHPKSPELCRRPQGIQLGQIPRTIPSDSNCHIARNKQIQH